MSMTRDEYQEVIDRTNQASMEVAMRFDHTIGDRIEELGELQPDKDFLIYEGEHITYAQVNERANQYARIALQHGIKQGETVALMMENRPQFFYVWFGMLKVGAYTALINTEAKAQAVTHALSTVDTKLAFVGSECMERYLTGDALCDNFPTIEVPDTYTGAKTWAGETAATNVDEAIGQAAAVNYNKSARDGLKNSATACYIFTSGTTGLPKAAYITHSKWLSTGHRWLSMTDLHADDMFYCIIPIFHGAGLMSQFSAVLATGATCVLKRRFSARSFWKDVAEYKVTSFVYVGEICRYLAGMPAVPEEKNHTLRTIMGAGMGIDVWQQFTSRFGEHIKIYEGWGSTESNCNMSNLDNRPGSCGRVPYWDRTFMKMVRFDVENDEHPRDENGFYQIAETGEAGELLGQVHMGDGTVISPFDGYSDKEASNKKLLRDVFEKGDCWFRTGDLFREDDEGYIYFVDRIGDTYRWKSENVSTTEVCQQLSEYTDAEIINVYGVKVPGQEGRAGMAAVVMAEGKSFDPQTFFAATDALASYAVPLFVRVIKEMDMTGTFKLRKVDMQKAGYDPALCDGELYLLDKDKRSYSPYSEAGLEALGVQPFQGA